MLFLPALLLTFPLEGLCKIYRMAFSQKVSAIWDVTSRFRGKFWSQGKTETDDTLPCAVIAAGSGCLFCLLSSPDAQIVLWFLPFCFHCSVHPMQSEYFNSPNTGRFIVNTGFCPLSTWSAGRFHKIPGYCIILRWQGSMICWQSHRRKTAVGRQYLTLQRQNVLYWLQAWNEKNSCFFWRPEITRNAFKFNHQHIHPGMVVRVCLLCMSRMASWAYRTWFARVLFCLTQECSLEITMNQSSHR